MRVTVDQKDIDALKYAIECVKATKDACIEASKAMKRIGEIIDRFYLERAKADELNEARALVRRLNSHWIKPSEVDKLSRTYLKNKKKELRFLNSTNRTRSSG